MGHGLSTPGWVITPAAYRNFLFPSSMPFYKLLLYLMEIINQNLDQTSSVLIQLFLRALNGALSISELGSLELGNCSSFAGRKGDVVTSMKLARRHLLAYVRTHKPISPPAPLAGPSVQREPDGKVWCCVSPLYSLPITTISKEQQKW